MARDPLGTVSGTLRAAKALIERYGWRQSYNNTGGYGPINSAVCVHDVIVRGPGAKRLEAMHAFVAATNAFAISIPPTKVTSIALVGWNDARGRTVEQVMSAFDEAIAAAEAQETS